MARGDGRFAFASRAAFVAVAVGVLAGCPPRAAAPGDRPVEEPAAAERAIELERVQAREALAPLVAAHNARVALLETFESPAAVMLRYPDGDRVQEDQLDGFIYLATRGRGAFELRLLGKTWAWLGGDGARSWIYFSPPGEPTVLHVYERLVDGSGTDATEVVGTAELTLLTPGSLRFLLGLAPIGDEWSVERIESAEGAEPRPLTERYAVRWSPTAATVATARFGSDGLPAALRVTDLAGTGIAGAALKDYASVQRANLAMGAWPKTATRVSIEALRSKASAGLVLDRDALVRRSPRARGDFFNLDELQLYLAPTEVIYHDASGAVRNGAPKPAAGPEKGP
jgi:hypothetical protein